MDFGMDGVLQRNGLVYCRADTYVSLSARERNRLSAIMENHPEIVKGYLVGICGPPPRTGGLQIGIELFGGGLLDATDEQGELLKAVHQETAAIIEKPIHYGVVMVNNLDLFFGPRGTDRFIELAECIYPHGDVEPMGS